MAIEIERKFLVLSDGWRNTATGSQWHRQGYLSKTPRSSVRVRRWDAAATITIKGARRGCAREEFEYPIPVKDADDMLRRLCAKPLIEKVRNWVGHAGMTWQVDEYCGMAAGLVLAEIELDHPNQAFVLPDWVGAEVTHDPRFRNSAIARCSWRQAGGRVPNADQDARMTAAALREAEAPRAV